MNILNKLSAFRIIVALLLIFIIFDFTFNLFISKRPKVFLFLDCSLSMADEKKFNKAIDFLENFKKEAKNFKIFSFGETIKELHQTNISCQEKKTDFRKIFDFSFLKKPDVILILSDGLHNYGSFSLTEKLPFQVHTVGFGLPKLYDFSIFDVNYPNFAFVKETIKINFRIKNTNLKGSIPVFLLADEKIIQKKELIFPLENVILEDSFKITFLEEGKKFLTLKISEVKEEIDYSNNQYSLTIDVKRKLAKILYLSNQPTFNLKFIKRILEENPDYQTEFIYTFDKKGFNMLTKDYYEVIIFDNFDFNVLKSNEREIVNNLIKKAKGILFLIDKNVNFANFSEYLPLLPEKIQLEKEVYFQLTEKGKESIILENFLEIINNLPPFSGYLKGKAKENSQVFIITEKDSSPLFSYHFYQNKIIALFSGFPFWRWLFLPDELLQIKLKDFFFSLLSFLKEGKYRIDISLDREVFYYGEEIKIKIFALDEIGKPAKDLNIILEIPKYEIKQVFNEIDEGLYQTKILPPDSGEFSFKISFFKNKEKIKEENLRLKILPELEEKKTPYLDTLFLKNLAQKGNGEFYLYPNVPTTFPFLEEKKKINLKIYFQNNFYIYLILISLYLLDIYLRKKKGLP
ncbi:MAG: hypothetical protein N2323_01575 [candidate division WOR-3 bacterium]|nr:hypothetical protein [candidate division WOR-3 bacterium]MCX7836636.1 hypothetical protein [candidate division WOR-3 bacterium]MDW8113316.1 hypothetical protein [candidate division WOR-3 bacterium]